MLVTGDPREGRGFGGAPLALIAVAALFAACGSDPAEPPDAGPPTSLIAFASSFADFRSWTSFHDDGPAAGTVAVDALSPRTQYLNKLPAHGATEWPIGTIIVEQRESGARSIFAGVKRGAGFNAAGAPGWEWFELTESATGKVSILWRGLGPPDGSESYGGSDRCNLCHAVCSDNDYICSPIMRLSQF